MTTRADIIAAARSFIGTPFHHQARLPGVGLDCIGVPVCAARTVGLPVVDSTDYRRRPSPKDPDFLIRHLARNLDRVETPQPADVVCFGWRDSALAYHLGIMTDPTHMVHAWAGGEKVLEVEIAPWMDRFHSAWSFRGLA